MALFLDSIVDKTPIMVSRLLGRNLFQIADLVAGAGPKTTIDYLRQYHWIRELVNRKQIESRELFMHRNPGYRTAMGLALSYIVFYAFDVLKRIAQEPDKVLWHEDLVPPQIFHAMGLVPFLLEAIPIVLPNLNTDITEHYIDVAENAGYPADICALPKTSMGMVTEDQLPPPKAIVTSNSPCDGGMASYQMMERKYKVPVFRLDLPYKFTEQRGMEYYGREVRRMIGFLEDVYSVKMNYEKLRAVCEEYNRARCYSFDIWDMMRASPAPFGGETLVFSHLGYPLGGGTKTTTRLMRNLLRIARRTIERDGGGIPNERHRVILWNPPPLIYPYLFMWMEKEYGAITVMDMLTFNRHPMIDTSSKETMLRDLGIIMAYGPMAQHTRGPYENFFTDLFYMYETYNADMIMMAGHLGCKNTRALFGMFREMCRKRSIPLLIFDYDLSDSRVVPPEGIKRQVADFMENVMGEKK